MQLIFLNKASDVFISIDTYQLILPTAPAKWESSKMTT